MIDLFNINNYDVNTSTFDSFIMDKSVSDLEDKLTAYVGAQHGCLVNSASTAIFLSLSEEKPTIISIPSIIPPVVLNMIILAGHKINFVDNTEWVGHSYIMHEFDSYKIIDSAQEIYKNKFSQDANDDDLMIFSFYPTKPIGGSDGGLIVSNNKTKIDSIKTLSQYGMSQSENSWDRKIIKPGWKFYMNTFQSFIVNENFKKLEQKITKLEKIRNLYNSEFGINNTSMHLYRIKTKNNQQFLAKMKEKNIQCGIHYKSTHNDLVYQKYSVNSVTEKLEKSNNISDTTASIPFHEKLSMSDVEIVINEVKKNA
tara:strand:+ start:1306 stop:2241 length:936 start_codon:yes stop_codon:yes gene_type:complete